MVAGMMPAVAGTPGLKTFRNLLRRALCRFGAASPPNNKKGRVSGLSC